MSTTSDLKRFGGHEPLDLEAEQGAFDIAWEARERMRMPASAIAAAGANPGSTTELYRFAQNASAQLRRSDEAVAFGRIDTEDGETLRIGYQAVFDDESNVLIINWQVPVAAPFYEASPSSPMGVQLRREYRCDRNTIRDFEDLIYADLANSIAALDGSANELADSLLDDLERSRDGEMRDIVRTIQGAQFEIIRADLAQLLVVQGGPGTGKTAIALHRVSWLLYNHRHELSASDVLVVGPNPTFTRYIRSVLPALGDQNVTQLDVSTLSRVKVPVTRIDEPATARLKGEAMMEDLLRRALQQRVGLPDDPIEHSVGRVVVKFDHDDLAQAIDNLRELPYATGRQRLRDHLIRVASEKSRTDEQIVRQSGIDSVLERLWPQLTPQSFLRDLLSSRDRLLAAAGDNLTAGQVVELQRRAAGRLADESWSIADIALLDAADALISDGVARSYRHIVVDEAQDLSPMQLRMIARRSATGSMTVVGDIAQSTGPWARDSWDEVIEHLRTALPTALEELRYGYRVPSQIFALAEQLLPYAAPEVTAPQVVRAGPADPNLVEVEVHDLVETAILDATKHAGHGRSVGIICPPTHMIELQTRLTQSEIAWANASDGQLGGSINVLRPADAKGLELDAIVVIEPADIVKGHERGLRMLYVAYTRSTKYLTVVHTGSVLPIPRQQSPELPPAHGTAAADGPDAPTKAEDRKVEATSDGWPAPSPAEHEAVPTPASRSTKLEITESVSSSGSSARDRISEGIVQLIAEEVIGLLSANASPALWGPILERARQRLEMPRAEAERADPGTANIANGQLRPPSAD